MNKTRAKGIIKTTLKCDRYLKPAPNHNGNTGFICDACGSGTRRGSGSTGAVEYYPRTNTWYCHACGAGSDVIDLYRYQTNCSYNEALEALAKQASITIDEPAGNSTFNGRPKKKTAQEPAKETKADPEKEDRPDYVNYYTVCADNLEKYPEAVAYLKKRGVSITTARRLLIGFDPAADPAKAPGALADENKIHPAPRIIAPCTTDYYTNRCTDPNTPKAYKSINPAGSHPRIFNEPAIYSSRTRYCFICEGLFDALAIEEYGHEAVALSSADNGKLLTELLKNRPTNNKTFIICFDNDPDPDTRAKVEKKAAELAEELARLNYKAITFNICGSAGDPNDAATSNADTFLMALDAAEAKADRDELDEFLNIVTSEAYKPIKTGLPYFDELTDGGILPQTMTILMAAPGAGKTILAQNIAEAMATHEPGRKLIYLNLEMAREQLLARAISARLYYRGHITRTAKQILQGYKWTDRERQEITETIDEYRRESLPNINYNPAKCTAYIEDIKENLLLMADAAKTRNEPAPALFLDYLQLIQTKSTKAQDIKEILKDALLTLKEYAVKNHTFVFLISAINRDSNDNITMSSGRDTSNIEFTAETILSLEDYNPDPGHMKLTVLKSRLSPAGKYQIIARDGANNIFKSEYTGHVEEPEDLAEWVEDPDEEQIIF